MTYAINSQDEVSLLKKNVADSDQPVFPAFMKVEPI